MSEVFGRAYAGLYDAIYRDKDYPGECALVERLLKAHAAGPVRRLLDLGCGTGRHAEIFAGHGLEVVGVDRSAGMLEQAKARQGAYPGLRFLCGDARDVVAGEPESFDATLMLFAVLSYHTENHDVAAALATVRRHLRPGGLFLFDVWFGPAVLAQRPETRTRLVEEKPGRTIRRSVKAELDILRQCCAVNIETSLCAGDAVMSHGSEIHVMRFFFPAELALLLGAARLELVRLGKFPEIEEAPDVTSWNVMVVARAV